MLSCLFFLGSTNESVVDGYGKQADTVGGKSDGEENDGNSIEKENQ
jgi:hypothetical protein